MSTICLGLYQVGQRNKRTKHKLPIFMMSGWERGDRRGNRAFENVAHKEENYHF